MDPKIDLLKSIYFDLYGPLDVPKRPGAKPVKMANLRELADKLSKIANREKPWTHRYLSSLLSGDKGFSISPELERAIHILENRLDGQPEIQARSRQITVFTVNGIEPDSVVFGHTTYCYCHLPVVFNHPSRKYCFEECRERARQERRKAR